MATLEEKRRTIRTEILLVLGVSLGQSALFAIVDLAGKLTAGKPLSDQATTLNPSQAVGRPWLDLALQVLQIFFGLVPAFLALHLLRRDGESQSGRGPIRFGAKRLGRDISSGVGLAALIGIPGLAFYLVSRALGLNTEVIPEALPPVWWAIPVLVLSAVQNAFLEEIVVVGYLLTRLREISWTIPVIVMTSALLRGSYHLYQGFGGFIGNAIMGTVFALFFLRFKRISPLIIAHAILDIVAFVGYALLKGQLFSC